MNADASASKDKGNLHPIGEILPRKVELLEFWAPIFLYQKKQRVKTIAGAINLAGREKAGLI